MTFLLDPAAHLQGLFVLETHDGDGYLGELRFYRDFVTVRTGFVGRPPVIAANDVAQIVPAAEHPTSSWRLLKQWCRLPSCSNPSARWRARVGSGLAKTRPRQRTPARVFWLLLSRAARCGGPST